MRLCLRFRSAERCRVFFFVGVLVVDRERVVVNGRRIRRICSVRTPFIGTPSTCTATSPLPSGPCDVRTFRSNVVADDRIISALYYPFPGRRRGHFVAPGNGDENCTRHTYFYTYTRCGDFPEQFFWCARLTTKVGKKRKNYRSNDKRPYRISRRDFIASYSSVPL